MNEVRRLAAAKSADPKAWQVTALQTCPALSGNYYLRNSDAAAVDRESSNVLESTHPRRGQKAVNNVTKSDSSVRTRYYENWRLDNSLLPATPPEDKSTHHSKGRKRDHHSHEHAARSHSEHLAENIREGNLPQPENKQVDDSWRPCVASAIERLPKHHAVSVKEESISDNAKTVDTILSDIRVVGVEPNDLRREENK